jgi:Zn-dependent alcohol dehydrogenase
MEPVAPVSMPGAGAVMNSLNVTPRSRFAVYGAGAVGLSALLAAKIRGASTLIAVDIVDSVNSAAVATHWGSPQWRRETHE